MKIIIVGYGPGGVAAAAAARAFDSSAEITIITEEIIDAHRKPGATMAFEFPDTDRLAIGDWSFATLKGRRIDVISGTTVLEGDSSAKKLTIRDTKGSVSTLNYDRLIIATGGSPAVPNLPGTDLSGVYTIQTMVDASVLGNSLDGIKSVAIIGAGFSGLETAERLRKLGKEVHLIVRSRLMRKQLEESMSEELQTRISKRIRVHVGTSPESVTGDKKADGIMLNGEKLDVDAVLFMTGVRPKVGLAKSLNVEIGPLGGIKVDNQMKTSLDGVYAVGDCVELLDSLSNKPV
ncbi:MAG: NAD(P)/FAD-dependent oxidoreductase, partial [Candidatus Thorarchaeota archaeon]